MQCWQQTHTHRSEDAVIIDTHTHSGDAAIISDAISSLCPHHQSYRHYYISGKAGITPVCSRI